MTRRTVQTLAALVAGLVLLLFVVRSFNGDSGEHGTLLLPEFAARANELDEIRIEGADASTTLERKDGKWVVAERNDYPADLGKLRTLVMALAEAAVLEEKTSNPELYDKLGLAEPADGGDGVKVSVGQGDAAETVVFGNTAQGEHRYARVDGQAASWLVDRNPEVPQEPGQWLDPKVIDVLSGDVTRMRIAHADGEILELAKLDDTATDFQAVNLPEGRELSYASVGNGMAGALGGLELEDVRPASGAAPATTTVFTTQNGLEVTVEIVDETVAAGKSADGQAAEAESPADEGPDDDGLGDDGLGDGDLDDAVPLVEHWLRLSAKSVPVADATDAGDPAQAADADAGTDAAADTSGDVEAAPATETPDVDGADGRAVADAEDAQERAEAINARVQGWEYKVPEYKTQLLAKRWDDILKAPAED